MVEPIRIYDNGDLLEIHFEHIVNYHGKMAYMAVGAGYRVVQAAFEALYGEEIPDREDLTVFSAHGGPGFRDVFEFVTRCKTRGVYTVDPEYPVAQYDPHRPTGYAYIFTRKDGKAVEVSLKEDYLPAEFYDFLKIGRERDLTADERAYFTTLKNDMCEKALNTPLEQFVDVRFV